MSKVARIILIVLSIGIITSLCILFYTMNKAKELENRQITFSYKEQQLQTVLNLSDIDYNSNFGREITYSEDKLDNFISEHFNGVDKNIIMNYMKAFLDNDTPNTNIDLQPIMTENQFKKLDYNNKIINLNITLKQKELTGLEDKTVKATDLMDYTDNGYEISNDKINILEKEINSPFKSERDFINRNGEIIKIPYCNETSFGFKLDVKELDNLIYDALENCIDQINIPFSREGRKYEEHNGIFNDIGNTYIEISLDDQHLWYFRDGQCLFDCDVVTGKDSTPTPKGAFNVMELTKNEHMKGSYGTAFAEYWLRLTNSGIGIHAANWRGSFGGNIYHSNGSHGCINIAVPNSKWLYENVERKTPAVIY